MPREHFFYFYLFHRSVALLVFGMLLTLTSYFAMFSEQFYTEKNMNELPIRVKWFTIETG